MLLFSILLLMHGMSREIHRIIGRFKRKSIVEIIRLKDGLDRDYPGNAYILETLEGIEFPSSLNGKYLKKYYPSIWIDA